MDKTSVRIAANSDGAAIKELLEKLGPVESCLSFDNINPYWLVVEMDGKGIVGCIQTLPSRPIGQLEMLAIDPELNDRERNLVHRELILSGCAVLAHHGASCVRGFVSFTQKGYKRILKKRGAIAIGQGNMMLRRIAP